MSTKPNSPSSKEENGILAEPGAVCSLNPDQPILQGCDDLLGRVDFAKQLAKFLSSRSGSPSVVIGLEGNWGSGKTSCLNFVRESITESGEAIVVQYAPWIVSTVDSLISGFFVQLATGLGQQTSATGLQKVARQLLKFGTLIQPAKLVPGVEPWGTVAEKILESGGRIIADQEHFADWDMVRQKDKLETELDKLSTPVVVLIDDLDRLPPRQICEVLQLVKAIGGFRNVSYLFAYDREVVSHAISEVHNVDGERYIEKMMAVTIPVPRLSQYHKLQMLKMNIRGTMLT